MCIRDSTSGTVIAVGQSSYGAATLTGTVTVKSGAALTAVGAQNGIEGSVLGDGTVFQLTAALGADFGPEDIVTEDKSTGLDLSEVKKSKLYTNVGGGTALWEYSLSLIHIYLRHPGGGKKLCGRGQQEFEGLWR